MRRAAAIVAVVMAVLVAGCTTGPKITAGAPRYVECDDWIEITGTVDPPKAMTSVVVQRTVNGKWVDWLWYETADSDEQAHKLIGTVDQRTGEFRIAPNSFNKAGVTVHLRVRASAAAGGTKVVSPGFYVTTTRPSIGCSSEYA